MAEGTGGEAITGRLICHFACVSLAELAFDEIATPCTTIAMVVRSLGMLAASVVVLALAAPPAGACGNMGPMGPDGQPLSVKAKIRDAGPVAFGQVVEIRKTRACDLKDPNNCGTLPTVIFRIDKIYKGVLDPIIEFYPIELCDFEVHRGDWMTLSPDPTDDDFKSIGITAPYTVFGGVGGWQPELDQFRKLWLDLEARAEERPDDPAGWRELARVFEEWRDYERALKAYDRSAALLPEDLDILASRGRIQFYLGMPEAGAVLSRVVAARPSDSRSRSLLALLQYESGTNSSMKGLDLRNADLRGRAFENADLSGSDFRGADLRGLQLNNVKLDETDLRGALFSIGPNGDRLDRITLRDANFAGNYIGNSMFGIVGILAGATDLRGIKLSDVHIPAWLLGGDDPRSLIHADLSGARITCDAIAEADWWKPKESSTPDYVEYQHQHWQKYIGDLKLAQRAVQEQPAALLDASCSEAIQNHLHENCAPWIAKADRSPACKLGD